MEICIGDYYRTKKGLISKVKTINTPETRKQKHLGYTKRNVLLVNGRYTLNDIKTHSKQPIDLIEDKDIVEIELSEEFVEKKDKKKLIQIGDIYTKETLQKDIDNGIITRILTILSYNQYMANCYKVGGEKCM